MCSCPGSRLTRITVSAIESNVGIICGCLPTLSPLVRHLSGTVRSTIQSRSQASGQLTSGVNSSRNPRHGLDSTKGNLPSWLYLSQNRAADQTYLELSERGKFTTQCTSRPRNDSSEAIVPPQGLEGGIVREVDVDIYSEDRDDQKA